MNHIIIPERLEALESGAVHLYKGPHPNFDDGHCAMEVVAWLAGEGHTDAPECASPVLNAFTIEINDRWESEKRQRLVPLLPRMVGTAGDGQDEARGYLALDWLVRTYTPVWLDLAGLGEQARALRDLQPITDIGTAKAAGPVSRNAQDAARAACDAARSTTWDAAGPAAKYAAGLVAGYAAEESALNATRHTAGHAAWSAVEESARFAALNAAGRAAWSASGRAAELAALNVSGSALESAVDELQVSALELLDRMIDPRKA